MINREIYNLIDECRKRMEEIDNFYFGIKGIDAHEKEQNFYKRQFENFGVKSEIVSDIYENRNDDLEIKSIKNKLETQLIKN